MPNTYSPTQLDFLIRLAGSSYQPAPRPFTQDDVRVLADLMLKHGTWYNNWSDLKSGLSSMGKGALNAVGDQGWMWDTSQNAAGNLQGYGGLAGSILGSADRYVDDEWIVAASNVKKHYGIETALFEWGEKPEVMPEPVPLPSFTPILIPGTTGRRKLIRPEGGKMIVPNNNATNNSEPGLLPGLF